MDWAGLKSLLRCGPNNSNQMYPYCNPNIFKLGKTFNPIFFFQVGMPISFLEIIILSSKQAKLHGEFSATMITSVHKMPTPSSMRDFKPISYLNIIYKMYM